LKEYRDERVEVKIAGKSCDGIHLGKPLFFIALHATRINFEHIAQSIPSALGEFYYSRIRFFGLHEPVPLDKAQ